MNIASCIDHTLLDLQATPEALKKLAEEAIQFHAACVCVYPQHLPFIPPGIRRACVINFPEGTEPLAGLLRYARNDVEEIDYVFPYPLYLAGETKRALEEAKTIIDACKKQGRLIKIILETECFEDDAMLYTLSKTLVEYGADFLKTSTGKKPIGATLHASAILLKAIRNTPCGIKISGGIRTLEKAMTFITQAEECMGKEIDPTWFRIGSSSLCQTNTVR